MDENELFVQQVEFGLKLAARWGRMPATRGMQVVLVGVRIERDIVVDAGARLEVEPQNGEGSYVLQNPVFAYCRFPEVCVDLLVDLMEDRPADRGGLPRGLRGFW